MRIKRLSSSLRSPRSFLLGLLTFLCLMTLTACGNNNLVEIYDNARVLNSAKVQHAASNLPDPIAIYTTSTFQGNQADFRRAAVRRLNGNPNLIVMAIDTTHRYMYIARGSNVQVSGLGVNQAVHAFSRSFDNGNYTSASAAAVNALSKSTKASSAGSGGLFSNPLTLLCCIVPLLLILFLALFGASKRHRIRELMQNRGFFGGSAFRRNPMPGQEPYERNQYNQQNPYQGPYTQRQGPYNQPYNQGQGPYNQPYTQGQGPYNQGPYYGPPNQGPYYGPPNQGRGMNPWAAGGLGAAAGGLAGYALGRREGERDGERNNEGPGEGNFGGGPFGGDTGGGGYFGGGGFGNEGYGEGGGFGNEDFGGGGFGNEDFGGGGFGNEDFGGGFDADDGGGGNF